VETDRSAKLVEDASTFGTRTTSRFPYSVTSQASPDKPMMFTQFILGFKNGDPECFKEAMIQVYDAVGKFSEDWKCERGCRYIVPAPSHVAHRVSESSHELCKILDSMFPWLQYREGCFSEKRVSVAAHQAYPGQRRTSTEHFESLGCRKADLAGASVILFDE